MKRKFVIISMISTLVIAFSVGGVFAFNFGKKKTSTPQRVVPKDSVGIDVARYQGDIDWQTVSKEKILFVYITALCCVACTSNEHGDGIRK